MLADRIEQLLLGGQTLFESNVPEHIEKLARHYYDQIKHKGMQGLSFRKKEPVGLKQKEKEIQEVDLLSLAMEDAREIGSEWLCRQAIDELGVEGFLQGQGWEEAQIKTALLHIICKATYPASEHKTAQWLLDNSAVAELFNMGYLIISRKVLSLRDEISSEPNGI